MNTRGRPYRFAAALACIATARAYVAGGHASSVDPPHRFVPGAQRVLLLGTGSSGVYRSGDGGNTWVRSARGLPAGGVWQVLADPVARNVAYAATGDVYRTADGGQHWTRDLVAPARTPGFTALAAQGTSVLAAGAGGIFVRLAGGRWVSLRSMSPPGSPRALLPVGRDRLYLIGEDSRLYESYSTSALGTLRWSRLPSGLPQGRVTALAYVPQPLMEGGPIGLYASVYGHGLYQSVDGGASWAHNEDVRERLPPGCTVRAVLATDIVTTYAAVEGRGLFRSQHANQFWKRAADDRPLTITALLHVGTTVIAATAGQGVHLYEARDSIFRRRGTALGVPPGVLGVSLAAVLEPPSPVVQVPRIPGHCAYVDQFRIYPVCGPFLRLYRSVHPSLDEFGNVLTGLLYDSYESKLIVQYFERARFEYRPDRPGMVALTPLGALLSRGMRFPAGATPPMLPALRFPSGYTLGGPFLSYWLHHGAARLLGYPISPPFVGPNGDGSGRRYTMQYLRYGRLEYHPENVGTKYSVLLGSLGQRYLCAQLGRYCTN